VEAVLLVGGQGTRLAPLTLRTPKPMLPIAGAPVLAHQVARLAAAGVDHVVLATSYRPEVFVGYFGTGERFGLAIDYVTEVDPLGTGGGIRNAAESLHSADDEPVVVVNGDVLTGHDLGAQLELHRARAADVTLHLVEVADARAFGCVTTGPTGKVTAFIEKSPDPPTRVVNAGCYVFARRVIDEIPTGRPVSVERETFPALVATGRPVYGYLDSSYWLDVGTPEQFVRASADLVLGVLPSPVLDGEPGEALLDGAAVEGTAVVDGGSALAAGVQVEAGARVSGSVVGKGARIGAGALVERSVLGPGAQVGARSRLTGAVIGDGAQVGADNELTGGIRIWPDAVIPDGAIRFSPPS
jgi:mannose-1-phosphate guanylyltransferase